MAAEMGVSEATVRRIWHANGLKPHLVPTAFNFFMNVDVLPDGRLKFAPPKCRAGDSMVLRAEMDLAIALSACPASTCNGGAPPRPLSFEAIAANVETD